MTVNSTLAHQQYKIILKHLIQLIQNVEMVGKKVGNKWIIADFHADQIVTVYAKLTVC